MFKNIFDYLIILICVFLIVNTLQSEVYYHKRIVTYTCAKAKYLKKDVTEKENKERVGWGLSKNKLVEFYQGKEDKSFLIVFTFTNGLACGLIGGNEFYFNDKLLKGE